MQKTHIDALIYTAREARERAYAPYSGYKVGAAVLTLQNRVYAGCNVENASYGLTVCAERVAIQKAVSEGETGIAAIAIVAGEKTIGQPCGACLQVIKEFAADAKLPVITACAESDLYEIHTLDQYLPLPFEL